MKIRSILLVVVLIAWGTGTASEAAVPQSKIIFSFAGINPRQAPLWIAQEQGFFSKNGLDTEIVFIRTGPIQVAAVSSGATQLAYAGGASVLSAAASGTDLKVIAS